MNRKFILAVALLIASPLAMAYQVTGPVLEVTDSKIVVQKGKEKWELARDAGTKVTVEYRMTATSIEARGGDKAKGKK